MKKKLLSSILILFLLVPPLFAKLAVSETQIYSGIISKIDHVKSIAIINGKKFYFKKNMYNELKLFKKLKKKVTVKFKKNKGKYIIEKIIFKLKYLKNRGKY